MIKNKSAQESILRNKVRMAVVEYYKATHGMKKEFVPGQTYHKDTDHDGGRERIQNMSVAELRAWFGALEVTRRIEEKEGRTLPVPPSEEQSSPIIQVYSPDQWHDDATILMNEAGRKKLIEALQSGATKLVIPAFVSDGEGYYLYVQVLPIDEIDKHKSPYTNEICKNLDGEAEKKEPKYPVTPEERKLIEQGKDAGEWKVIV